MKSPPCNSKLYCSSTELQFPQCPELCDTLLHHHCLLELESTGGIGNRKVRHPGPFWHLFFPPLRWHLGHMSYLPILMLLSKIELRLRSGCLTLPLTCLTWGPIFPNSSAHFLNCKVDDSNACLFCDAL